MAVTLGQLNLIPQCLGMPPRSHLELHHGPSIAFLSGQHPQSTHPLCHHSLLMSFKATDYITLNKSSVHSLRASLYQLVN